MSWLPTGGQTPARRSEVLKEVGRQDKALAASRRVRHLAGGHPPREPVVRAGQASRSAVPEVAVLQNLRQSSGARSVLGFPPCPVGACTTAEALAWERPRGQGALVGKRFTSLTPWDLCRNTPTQAQGGALWQASGGAAGGKAPASRLRGSPWGPHGEAIPTPPLLAGVPLPAHPTRASPRLPPPAQAGGAAGHHISGALAASPTKAAGRQRLPGNHPNTGALMPPG